MKALITGITGFAGGHLAEHMVAQGDQVIGSARTAWSEDAPREIQQHCPLLTWDIAQPAGDAFVAAIRAFRPEFVFHLAGMSVPSDCGRDAPTPAATRANVDGVRNVADLVATLESRPRLVFVSSCQVYASPADGRPVPEDHPRNPSRGYGKTKAAAEDLIFERTLAGSLDAIILRAFNHTGPRQAPRMMLPEWASQLAAGLQGPLRIVSRDSHLDMTDVRDIVKAYRELALHGQAGEAYNVGSGRNIRSGDVLEILLHRYDADVAVEERSPGHSQLPVADITRMKSLINWRPRIELAKTIDDTMLYWMEQNS